MLHFEDCVGRIEQAYRDLGHSLGWRFLSGPRRTFAESTEFAFVTLNPGGNREYYPGHSRESSENGSAYWIESWDGKPPGESHLQIQVHRLFEVVVEIASSNETSVQDFVESKVLTGHFIPFRSPSIDTLHRRRESEDFAKDLWTDILASWTPPVILTMGGDVFRGMDRILRKRLGAASQKEHVFETGWGGIVSRFADFHLPRNGGRVRLVGIPHLSRYKLFSHPKYDQNARRFLEYVLSEQIRQGADRRHIRYT